MANKFSPILTPDSISRIHRELSLEAQKTIDDMADYLGENYCKKCTKLFPGDSGAHMKRERAREIIYVLVLHGYLGKNRRR